MKKLVATIHAPGRLTVLAALLAGLSVPAMAVSPNLVISQVYGGGGNANAQYKNDFIEIFNRGNTAVTATGWSVQYGSANSAADWSGKSILPTFTIEPGQYILIQEQSGGAIGAVLPSPVVVPASGFNLSAANGKVALVNNSVTVSGPTPATPNVVDMVGFGTANGAEGSAAAAGSNVLALLRANAGCTDTDVNSADFSTAAPVPRTSASPFNACGGGAIDQPIVATCPATLAVAQGQSNHTTLSAADPDSMMLGASITGGATAGISLTELVRSVDGRSGSADLVAAPGLASGIYPVIVTFTNNSAQTASCTVNVAVEGSATIPQIQGAGNTSPYKNTVQTTEGVVTHVLAGGYFLQDASGDGNPSTSDGLFIYTGAVPAVAKGDLVRVKGTVLEYLAGPTYTELGDIQSTTVLSGGNSITPVNVEFVPGMDLEPYEGMLVNFTNDLTVNQTEYLGTRGELSLAVGRRETPTNRFRPGTPEAIALAADNLKNELILDDSLFVAPQVVPYLGQDNTVRAGDTVGRLTGVLDFGAIGGGGAAFKLHPTVAPIFSRTNARTAAPVLPTGNARVASANVLNFFTTFTNGENIFGQTGQGCTIGASTSKSNCRGADNLAEFVRQRDKIVKQLLAVNADVVGLMEIQNNGDIAVNYLVQQLNAAVGFQTYAYVPAPPATGTDAIRVAMIYKPAMVTPVGAALSDSDAVNNRPPMAQTFKHVNGAKFSVIVNHLKAKAGCGSGLNGDLRDGQGCHNYTRTLQAKRLAEYFIPAVEAASGDQDILVIGDMNAHGFEDPIHLLTQAGLVNELEKWVRPNEIPYSYVFDGHAGYLDHALATGGMDQQIIGATEWHANADEPTVIDYNLDGKSDAADALYVNDAFRSSDHDPVVVALNLTPTFFDVTGSFSTYRSGLVLNRMTNKYSGTISITNTTSQPMTGAFHVRLDNLPAGVTLDNASGTFRSAPYVTISGTTIAPGARVTVPVVFSNPNKVSFNYAISVFNGTF